MIKFCLIIIKIVIKFNNRVTLKNYNYSNTHCNLKLNIKIVT